MLECATEHDCVESVNHSNVLVEERGRSANFKNPSRSQFCRIKVDDCLVTEGPRADWIVAKAGVGSVIVELKGRDLDHACRQVFETLGHRNCVEHLQGSLGLLIVCSRYPSFDTAVAKAKVRAKKLGVKLLVKCNRAELEIETAFD